MKKCLAIMLAAVMIFSLAVVPASAEVFYKRIGFIELSDNEMIVIYNGASTQNDALDGASYNEKTNTLTLRNIKTDLCLYAGNMGKLNIAVFGENKVGCLLADDRTSMRISGSGKLVADFFYSYSENNSVYPATLTVDKTASLKLTSEKNSVGFLNNSTPVDKAFKAGENYVQLEKSEEISTVNRTVYGVPYTERVQSIYDQVSCKTDPDGLYTVRTEFTPTVYSPDDYGRLIVDKYAYSDTIGIYINDPSFEPKYYDDEAEMIADGYEYVIGKKTRKISIKDGTSNYTGYVLNNPDDPDGLYYARADFLEDKTTDDFVYSVDKLEIDENTDKKINLRSTETRLLTTHEMEKEGITFTFSDNQSPSRVQFYRNDTLMYYYKAEKSDEPGTIYAVNDYPYINYNGLYSLNKAVASEEEGKYKPDENFKMKTYTLQEFVDKGFSFEKLDVHKKLSLNYGNLKNYTIVKDSDENLFAAESKRNAFGGSYYQLYGFSEDNTTVYDGRKLYYLTKLNTKSTGEVTAVTTTITDTEYFRNGAFSFNGSGAVKLSECKISVGDSEYSGKSITPKVTVKYGNTTLKKGTDYTVTYSDNKNVGTAKVTLKGKDMYSGTVKKTFKILPKSTAIKSLTPKKQVLAVKWKKISKQSSGYQIQYSLSSSFKSAKTKTVRNAKTTAMKIKKLTSRKTYYVRVRVFRKVSGKNFFSAWSKLKKARVK